MVDPLVDVIQDKTGWKKIPTRECGGPSALGFFVEYKEEGDFVINKIEDTTTISSKIAANGHLEQILNLHFHKATEEEIKEYKDGP